MDISDRHHFKFKDKVRKFFSYLDKYGFREVEASATLVLYKKNNVEIDIYHGRNSYEIGVGVSAFGSRYSMSEIIRLADETIADRFHCPASTSIEGIVAGLKELSCLLRTYGNAALECKIEFFSELENQRITWAEEYALDVLSDQLRPLADEAFRRGDYKIAADLYSRIEGRLSLTEIKKLHIAKKRRNPKE